MANNKQSDFTTVSTVDSDDFFGVFSSSENKKITRDNLFNQFKNAVIPKFIYKTIELLQAADLEADEDDPTYVRCEETEYRLYKITSLAPGVDDISLNNGTTATYQIEYRDSGFVIGPGSSTAGALAVFADSSGENLGEGATPTDVGSAIIEISSVGQKSYTRVNADDSAELVTVAQLKTDLSLPADTVADLALKAPLESPEFTGDPTAPTPAAGDNSESLATTEFVRREAITTVATIADAKALTGLTAGQQISVKEYNSGTNIGGGVLEVVSGATTEDEILTFASAQAGVYLQRINYNVIYSSFAGIDGTSSDHAKLLALRDAAESTGLRLILDSGDHYLNGEWAFDYDGVELEFINNSQVTQHADNIAILLGGGVTKRSVAKVINPKIVTAGFGANNAGLIQVTNIDDWEIHNPIIESDRAAANARSRVYNGIATAITTYGRVYGGKITGTAKSGVHVSTEAEDVKFYGTYVDDTGVHDTATYGFSPGFDSGGVADNHFIGCVAKNTQGEFFLVMAENSGTYGEQICRGNSIINCSGENAGKSAVRFGTLTTGYVPKDCVVEGGTFLTTGLAGLEIGAGIVKSVNNSYKNTQTSSIAASSTVEYIEIYSLNDTCENFDLVDNINQNGISIGTVAVASIESPKIKHDFVGVTAGNIYAIGTVSARTVSNLRILDPQFNTVTQHFRFLGTTTYGYIRYAGLGAPSNSLQPNGSEYSRSDGVGVNDNKYIRRGAAWVGIA